MNSKATSPDRCDRVGRPPGWRRHALAIATAALGTCVLAGTAAAQPTTAPPDASASFAFQTQDNQKDPTFNQLLGINDWDTISGYFGSGAADHPNRGYTLRDSTYRDENFPGSAQTQVTGLNNSNITVGFWADAAGDNFGFYSIGGRWFRSANYPVGDPAQPSVDQLLGVNDADVAVGFYTDTNGVNHGYSYNIRARRYETITVDGDSNVTAAAINNVGAVAGFATNAAGTTEGYLELPGGNVIHLNVPGASSTQALGVNNRDEVVGDYTTGSSTTPNGFIWAPGRGFEMVNDPNGVNGTTINGLNDRGILVGFYMDANGLTHGLIARPDFEHGRDDRKSY
jgi:hypothetical protein